MQTLQHPQHHLCLLLCWRVHRILCRLVFRVVYQMMMMMMGYGCTTHASDPRAGFYEMDVRRVDDDDESTFDSVRVVYVYAYTMSLFNGSMPFTVFTGPAGRCG